MYEVLKNTNPNANDNEIIVRLVQGLWRIFYDKGWINGLR
jgi:hypothetical protein